MITVRRADERHLDRRHRQELGEQLGRKRKPDR
jgi:hypothetical protein